PEAVDRGRRVVGRAPPPEVRAPHPEHARHESRDVAFVTDDVDALPLVELVPQHTAPAVPTRMHAEVSVLGDLADGVADLVDAAGDHPARRTRADTPNEIALRVTREPTRRRENA